MSNPLSTHRRIFLTALAAIVAIGVSLCCVGALYVLLARDCPGFFCAKPKRYYDSHPPALGERAFPPQADTPVVVITRRVNSNNNQDEGSIQMDPPVVDGGNNANANKVDPFTIPEEDGIHGLVELHPPPKPTATVDEVLARDPSVCNSWERGDMSPAVQWHIIIARDHMHDGDCGAGFLDNIRGNCGGGNSVKYWGCIRLDFVLAGTPRAVPPGTVFINFHTNTTCSTAAVAHAIRLASHGRIDIPCNRMPGPPYPPNFNDMHNGQY